MLIRIWLGFNQDLHLTVPPIQAGTTTRIAPVGSLTRLTQINPKDTIAKAEN